MKHIKLLSWITILLVIDLLTKYLFYNNNFLINYSRITPTLNTGISRSLPIPMVIILLISILGIGACIRLYTTKKIGRILTMFLIAGTIGNLIDRIVYGGVRDFINIWLFNFPIFNFADIMLNIGAIIRIIIVILEKRK